MKDLTKNLLVLFAILIGPIICTQAQVNNNKALGMYFDNSGMPINNYVDLDYLPGEALSISLETDNEFIPGACYDLTGKKVNCDIKQSNLSTEVYFRTNEREESLLNPNKCSGYVAGLDSFVVISNFQINGTLTKPTIKERAWAQVVTTTKNYTLLKNVYQRAVNNSFVTTYIVKSDSSQLTSLIDEKAFLKFFGDFDAIKDTLEKTRLTDAEIAILAKHYEYKEKYEKDEKIYFSQSWEELRGAANATYYAKIKGLKGLVWELQFFDNSNTLLYSGHFSSFFPMVKHGEFTWFYPDGNIRKKINYKDDDIEGPVTEYFQNGRIHYICKHPNENKGEYKYLKVLDIEGRDLLDTGGNGVEIVMDTVNNREITRRYISNRLYSSTFMGDNNNRVIQYGNSNAHIRSLGSFQRRMREDYEFNREPIDIYHQGLVLVKFLVDSMGNTMSYKIVKGAGNPFDHQLISFLGSSNCQLKWSQPIHREKHCFQEIVLPVVFEVQTIRHVNTNYNNGLWMWQQQNMTRQINPPKTVTPTYKFR